MLFWTLGWMVISLTMISLIHYIYNFLLDKLTVRKVRDVRYDHDSHYQEIVKSFTTHVDKAKNEQNEHDEVPDKNISMQDELKSFLNNYSSNDDVTKLEDL